MPRPVVTETTEIAYAATGPLAEPDEQLDWPLLRYLDGLLRQLHDVESLSRDSDTHEGWGVVLDVDAAPAKALDWLAQFVGVVTIKGLTEANQRLRIREAAGFKRGTVAAIRAAAQQYLSGSQRVDIAEREGSAYRFRVTVYKAQMPTPSYGELAATYATYGEIPSAYATYGELSRVTLVENALLALKPGGLVLNFVVAEGISYDELEASFGTYDDMDAALTDYNAQTSYL